MKITLKSLIAIFLCINFVSLKAQDVTSIYLTNPSFETGDLTGWNLTGADGYAWATPNTDGDNTKDGDYITGVWNNPIGDLEWSQSITNLPNGFYKVGCLVTVSNNRLSSQRLFADGKSMLYGAELDYPATDLAILRATENLSFGEYTTSGAENGAFKPLNIIIEVTDGTLNLGNRVNGSAAVEAFSFKDVGSDIGFFKFDAFSLINISDLLVKSLTIGGEIIADYNADDIILYTKELKSGVNVAPEVLATAGDGVNVNIIPASGVPGKTEIILSSSDNSYSVSYFVEFKKTTDATLASITADVGTLSPEFSSSESDYDLSVPFGTTSVQLNVVPSVEGATVSIVDYLGNEYENGIVPFSGDGTDVDITVTALDGQTTSTYYMAIDFDAEAKSADLSDLTLSVGELSPAFDKDITTYNALLPIGTTSVKPTATPLAAVAIVTSGDEEVSLNYGHGKSRILVTAGDGSTKTYTIIYNYNYLVNPGFETGDLSDWTVTGADGYTWIGTGNDGDGSQEGVYNAGVWNRPIGDVEFSQALTNVPNGFYKVNCLMSVTDIISWTDNVSHRSSTQRIFANTANGSYSTLYGPQSQYSLINLAVIDSTEDYAFAYNHFASGENGPFYPVSVIVEVTDGNLTIGARTNGDSSIHSFDFQGANTDKGFFKIDDFSVSNISDLMITSLSIDGNLVTDFNTSSTHLYHIVFPTETSDIPEITATVKDATAKIKVVPATGLPGATEIIVTAADSSYSVSYFVDFVLDQSSNATLSSLTTDVGTLSPAFDAGILNYDLNVPAGTTSLTLMPTASNNLSTVQGGGVIDLSNGGTIEEIVVSAVDESKLTYVVKISISTSVPNNNSSVADVYPTITNDVFHVTGLNSGVVRVYDVSGVLVLFQPITSTDEILSINKKGLYILMVESEGKSSLFKVLKK